MASYKIGTKSLAERRVSVNKYFKSLCAGRVRVKQIVFKIDMLLSVMALPTTTLPTTVHVYRAVERPPTRPTGEDVPALPVYSVQKKTFKLA